jgi:hypothetical protein
MIARIFNVEREDAKSWVSTKLFAAVPCSALSVCCANPFDVLKVRFQRNAKTYRRSSIHPKTVFEIIRKEGFFGGLYSGFLPNVARNCAVGGAELVGYYQSKEFLLNNVGLKDNTPTHVIASFGAALSAAIIGSPFDVVGTRLMQAPKTTSSSSVTKNVKKPGLLSFTREMLRNEGLKGFYKGFSMNLLRLWSFNLVLWVGYEKIQRIFAE